MNEETRKMIEALAAKLGTTAEHLWAVLLRQAWVSFWTDLLFYAITLGFVYVAYRLSVRAWRKGNEGDWNEEEWKVASIACSIVAATLVVISACSIGWTVTKVANPEYYAWSEVLGAVK